MTCYHPIPAFRVNGTVTLKNPGSDGQPQSPDLHVPCGNCVGCWERRARDWSLRCSHEAQMHGENCFVTLTYRRDALPPGSSLDHRDYQLFMKRLRITRERTGFRKPVRFFMCGEYGPENQRPHYHALLFGCNFYDRRESGKSGSGQVYYDSAALDKLWSHGRVSVQDVTPGTIAYCANYILEKFRGTELEKLEKFGYVDYNSGEILMRKPEYMACSKGVGKSWFEKFGRSVFPQDFIVLEGRKYAVPKAYNRWNESDIRMDEIEFRRQQGARKHFENNSDERLKVREKVHNARLSRLKRSLEE